MVNDEASISDKLVFRSVKFFVKSLVFLLLLIQFLKTVYDLINELNEIKELMDYVENIDNYSREARVMACAQHLLYVPILLLTTFAILTNKHQILLLFSVINALLIIKYLWNLRFIWFLSIDFLVIASTLILSFILYFETNIDTK